jgi:hypothetical protein
MSRYTVSFSPKPGYLRVRRDRVVTLEYAVYDDDQATDN